MRSGDNLSPLFALGENKKPSQSFNCFETGIKHTRGTTQIAETYPPLVEVYQLLCTNAAYTGNVY